MKKSELFKDTEFVVKERFERYSKGTILTLSIDKRNKGWLVSDTGDPVTMVNSLNFYEYCEKLTNSKNKKLRRGFYNDY